jgi:hypothetical protein
VLLLLSAQQLVGAKLWSCIFHVTARELYQGLLGSCWVFRVFMKLLVVEYAAWPIGLLLEGFARLSPLERLLLMWQAPDGQE